MKMLLLVLSLILLGQTAEAVKSKDPRSKKSIRGFMGGECTLSIVREACPGKDSVAYPPYGPGPIVVENHAVSAKDCNAKARQRSKILRLGVLKKIIVTPTFEGTLSAAVSSEAACGGVERSKKKVFSGKKI